MYWSERSVCFNLFDFGYISDEGVIVNQIIQLLQLSQIFYILFTDSLQTQTQTKYMNWKKHVIKSEKRMCVCVCVGPLQ